MEDVKTTMNSVDYTDMNNIIEKELENDEELNALKHNKNSMEYRTLRMEKIEALHLEVRTKWNLNLFDENFYSYKLIFIFFLIY